MPDFAIDFFTARHVSEAGGAPAPQMQTTLQAGDGGLHGMALRERAPRAFQALSPTVQASGIVAPHRGPMQQHAGDGQGVILRR